MAYTPGIDISDITCLLSTSTYVSTGNHVYTNSIDLGSPEVELSTGIYISTGTKLFSQYSIDIGSFNIESGIVYIRGYYDKTFTDSIEFTLSSRIANILDDTVIIEYGELDDFIYWKPYKAHIIGVV